MKHFMGKLTATALALSMVLGMSTVANAATTNNKTYSLYVKDQKVQFLLNDKVAATYNINNDNIELITDKEGDFLVCFYDDRGTHKGISLGNQKSLSVSGTVTNLRLDDSLSSSISLTVASDALVKNLNVRSDSRIYVNGRVSDLETDAAAKVEVSSTGTVSNADLLNRKAKLHAEKGATVKRVQYTLRSNVTGDVDSEDIKRIEDYDDTYDYYGYDYDDRDSTVRIDLEINDIYAHKGDTLRDLLDDLDDAVYAYVDDEDSDDDGNSVGGRVHWRNEDIREELESSGRHSFTFVPTNSKYRIARGTVYVVVR